MLLSLLLIIAGLGVFAWLISRIYQYSTAGGIASALLVIPAFYWTYKLWNNTAVALRKPAYACIAVNLVLLPIVLAFDIGHLGHYIVGTKLDDNANKPAKVNTAMEAWCKEKNDARYDAVLDTCVALDKQDLQQREQTEHQLDRFAQHLNTHGVAGTVSYTTTPVLSSYLQRAEVVSAAQYTVATNEDTPLSAVIVLCATEQSCQLLARQTESENAQLAVNRKRVALIVSKERLNDAAIAQVREAVNSFDTPAAKDVHKHKRKGYVPVYQ